MEDPDPPLPQVPPLNPLQAPHGEATKEQNSEAAALKAPIPAGEQDGRPSELSPIRWEIHLPARTCQAGDRVTPQHRTSSNNALSSSVHCSPNQRSPGNFCVLNFPIGESLSLLLKFLKNL